MRLGGDADTIGAMAGAIAGAYHGAEAIAPDWLAALENGAKGRDYVRGLGKSLFERFTAGRTEAPKSPGRATI